MKKLQKSYTHIMEIMKQVDDADEAGIIDNLDEVADFVKNLEGDITKFKKQLQVMNTVTQTVAK